MKVGILGGGESAVGTALLAHKLGSSVYLSDIRPLKPTLRAELPAEITVSENGHNLEQLAQADIIVKSPGIERKNPVVKELLARGMEVIGEIEYAYRTLIPASTNIIGITGSNGKTTTCYLIHDLLQRAGLDAGLCGNIGNSFARMLALEALHSWYVIELSSFQLEDIVHFRPHIAIILNVNNNHLDRYNYNINEYAATKLNIVKNQKAEDYFIYDLGSQALVEEISKLKIESEKHPYSVTPHPQASAWIEENSILLNMNTTSKKRKVKTKLSLAEIHSSGFLHPHTTMASSIVGNLVEIRNEHTRNALSEFQNKEHRLESVGYLNGVHFINDSKGTNVNAAWFALDSLAGKIVWIVGGVDKGNDYGTLLDLVKAKVKAIVILGKNTQEILDAFNKYVPTIDFAESMQEAVEKSYRLAESEDTVLLSPACASFDLFENYQQRGKSFKESYDALALKQNVNVSQ